MEFRIGVNMGDVVIEGDNLYGEGINVAARLEALAQSGGVCLSKNVYDIGKDLCLQGKVERKVPGTKKAVILATDVVGYSTKTEVRTQTARDNLPIILVKPFKSLGGEDASVSNAITA